MPQPPTVVYAVDPLCGWCFAVGDALREARARLAGELRWEVALGGLVVGDRVRPVRADADYLRRGFAAVAAASGRRPSAAYWQRVVAPGRWVSDSEPAVRAVVAARDLARGRAREPGPDSADEVAMTVAHLLCDALYLAGRTPDDPATVEHVGEQAGLDGPALRERWESPAGRAAVPIEYARARSLGVTTYPSLFVRADDRGLVPVLAGYAPADDIVQGVRAAASVAA